MRYFTFEPKHRRRIVFAIKQGDTPYREELDRFMNFHVFGPVITELTQPGFSDRVVDVEQSLRSRDAKKEAKKPVTTNAA